MKNFNNSANNPPPMTSQAGNWERNFLILLAVVFVWRVFFLTIVPLDLIGDEAYYWDWSRHLDWGYYSKPPMIAWINALSTSILGSTPFSVRLPAAILGTSTLGVLFLLARRLFDSRVAFWTAVTAVTVPAYLAINVFMTVDAPLLFFWCLSLYGLWRALENKENSWRWLLGTAIIAGFGLLTKQMMLVFFALMLLFMATNRQDRPLLRQPWPYLSIVIALLMLLPVVWWNWQHDWITLQHTSHHFSTDKGFFNFLRTVPEFLGSQLLLISPLTGFLFATITTGFLLKIRRQNRNVRYLVIFSVVSLLAFVLMSFRQSINPNWPAAFYPAGIILLSAWGCGAVSCGAKLDRWQKLYRPGLMIGAALTILGYALPFVIVATDLGGGKLDPTRRLRGWHELSQKVGVLLADQPRPDKTFLVGVRRAQVSELAFYMDGQPQVYRWAGLDRKVSSQYEMWDGPLDKIGWDGLIVLRGKKEPPPDLVGCFASVRDLGVIEIPLGRGGAKEFSIFLGENLLKWPK